MAQSQIVAFTRKIRPWQFVLVLMVAYLSIVLIAEGGDTKTFVQLGSCYSQCAGIDPDVGCPNDTEEGYDGQFVYYIARDPSGAAPCIDVPAYRYQRILLPILGRYMALGIEDLMPIAFVIINLLALVGSTTLLEQLLVQLNVSRWFAITYGLFFGSVIAVRVSTTEPLAYGLVVAAVWLSQQENERLWLQTILLAAAASAKETTGLFVAGFLFYYALEKRWKDALRLALVVGISFGLWQLYLYDWLGTFGIGAGGAGGTSFEIIPYNGIWRIAYDDEGSLAAFVILGILFIPSVMLPSVWGLWATIREFRNGNHHLYTCLFFATLAIMPFVPFSTYREFIGIYRFIIGMVMMHILYCGLRYQGRPLVYSTLWLVLLFIVAFI